MIDHLEMVLQYQRGLYEASGGTVADREGVVIAVGSYVKVYGRWHKVLKVNPKTLNVDTGYNGSRGLKVDKTMIRAVKTAEEYNSDPDGTAPSYKPKEPSKEQELARDLQVKADALAKAPIVRVDGLFPTPQELVCIMTRKANIREGMRLLEPSAGTGAIFRQLTKFLGVTVDYCEIDYNCRHYLETQGASTTQGYGPAVAEDFLEYNPGPVYDRVVMNPPFENGQDITHVIHAYDCLKSGGRIVAIMSDGSFFRSDHKATEFREWLDGKGESEKLPINTFKASGTQVATRLVIIDKP